MSPWSSGWSPGQFPRETNPGFVALAARTVREIVSGSDLARTQH